MIFSSRQNPFTKYQSSKPFLGQFLQSFQIKINLTLTDNSIHHYIISPFTVNDIVVLAVLNNHTHLPPFTSELDNMQQLILNNLSSKTNANHIFIIDP